MARRRILVGLVQGAFGVRGELRIRTYTEDPATLLRYGALSGSDGACALTLEAGRPHKGGLVARARGVATREAAETLSGLELYVEREALPAPDPDEFYLADLIGLDAVGIDGAALGRIRAVHNFGAGDLLEIEPPDGRNWLVAFTRETVPEVRLADGLVVIAPPGEA